MTKYEVAEVVDRLVDRTMLDLSEVPSTMLKRLKGQVDKEIEKRSDEKKVRLITVGAHGFIDKCFRQEDEELAHEYARKRLEGQIKKGRMVSVDMSFEVVKESDVASYLSGKGEYEE